MLTVVDKVNHMKSVIAVDTPTVATLPIFVENFWPHNWHQGVLGLMQLKSNLASVPFLSNEEAGWRKIVPTGKSRLPHILNDILTYLCMMVQVCR